MSPELLIACIVGFIIWLAIIHEIIRSAVKSGTRRQTRLQIMWMIKNGIPPEEIKHTMDMDESDFWNLFNPKKEK